MNSGSDSVPVNGGVETSSGRNSPLSSPPLGEEESSFVLNSPPPPKLLSSPGTAQEDSSSPLPPSAPEEHDSDPVPSPALEQDQESHQEPSESISGAGDSEPAPKSEVDSSLVEAESEPGTESDLTGQSEADSLPKLETEPVEEPQVDESVPVEEPHPVDESGPIDEPGVNEPDPLQEMEPEPLLLPAPPALEVGSIVSVQVLSALPDLLVVAYYQEEKQKGDGSPPAPAVLFTGALIKNRSTRLPSNFVPPTGINPPGGFRSRLRADNPRDYDSDADEFKKKAIYKRHTYFNESLASKENLHTLAKPRLKTRLRARRVLCQKCGFSCNDDGSSVGAGVARASRSSKRKNIVMEKRDARNRRLTLRPVLKPLRRRVVDKYLESRRLRELPQTECITVDDFAKSPGRKKKREDSDDVEVVATAGSSRSPVFTSNKGFPMMAKKDRDDKRKRKKSRKVRENESSYMVISSTSSKAAGNKIVLRRPDSNKENGDEENEEAASIGEADFEDGEQLQEEKGLPEYITISDSEEETKRNSSFLPGKTKESPPVGCAS